MKPTLLPFLAALIVNSVCATEVEHASQEAPIHDTRGFYAAVKGLVTFGDKIEHERDVTLEGDVGTGFGIEAGYKLGYGFALEGDVAFARNRVTEHNCAETHEDGCEHRSADGTYTSVSLDLAYTYHLMHHLGVFVKGGYENEYESIDGLGISGNSTGAVYALGGEYAIGSHTAIMVEYEGTTIEGPRGNSLFAGVLYAF